MRKNKIRTIKQNLVQCERIPSKPELTNVMSLSADSWPLVGVVGRGVSVPAERCGLVQGNSRNSHGKEVQHCSVWRYVGYFASKKDV